jgi:DNA-binding NarL/FixJ family response regulator
VTHAAAKIRIVLVEDSDVYRESLAFLLRGDDELQVVGAVADGAAGLRACIDERPDVAVVDFRLPDGDGAEIAGELGHHCPEIAVVFLSASAGPEQYDAASSVGAALVRKDEGLQALVDAVRAAVR